MGERLLENLFLVSNCHSLIAAQKTSWPICAWQPEFRGFRMENGVSCKRC
jgi:hypothetical protein